MKSYPYHKTFVTYLIEIITCFFLFKKLNKIKAEKVFLDLTGYFNQNVNTWKNKIAANIAVSMIWKIIPVTLKHLFCVSILKSEGLLCELSFARVSLCTFLNIHVLILTTCSMRAVCYIFIFILAKTPNMSNNTKIYNFLYL